MQIFWRLMFTGSLALLLVLGAVPAEVAAGGAVIQRGTFTFPAMGACQTFPDVGFAVCGTAGTVDYQVKFTPSGNENSWFKVQGFTGVILRCIINTACSAWDPLSAVPFSDASAKVMVHLGPNRPDFILVNHPSVPVPHRIPLD